jgi:hypothetical protein
MDERGVTEGHQPDATYTDHPQHQPRVHAPATTGDQLIAIAMKVPGVNQEELGQLGAAFGPLPMSTHDTQFLARLLGIVLEAK